MHGISFGIFVSVSITCGCIYAFKPATTENCSTRFSTEIDCSFTPFVDPMGDPTSKEGIQMSIAAALIEVSVGRRFYWPCDKQLTMQCSITRLRSGMQMLHPEYHLFVDLKHEKKFLLSAKRFVFLF